MDADAWIDTQPEPVRADLRVLHAAITAAAPRLPVVAASSLSYGPFRYRYPSGREGESALVSVAIRAHGFSIYVNATDGEGYLAEAAAARLGKVKVGRSCITFKRVANLDLAELAAVIRRAVEVGGAGAVEG